MSQDRSWGEVLDTAAEYLEEAAFESGGLPSGQRVEAYLRFLLSEVENAGLVLPEYVDPTDYDDDDA